MERVDRFDLNLPPIDEAHSPSFDLERKPIVDHPRGDMKLLLLMDSGSCGSYLHDEEKKPIGDHPRGEVHSPPLMDSRSRGSYLQEKSCDKEFREISSAEVDDRKQKEKKVALECEAEEERRDGVSPVLMLKKKLTKSDVGHLSRLLIPRACVSQVLLKMSEETATRVKSSNGADVVVWDADMRSEHQLVFAFWESSGAYILKRRWIKEFVHRRGLAAGDEIEIYWHPKSNRIN